jgi:hypothetical protein
MARLPTAIGVLESQHREMEDLFEELGKATGAGPKGKLFTQSWTRIPWSLSRKR